MATCRRAWLFLLISTFFGLTLKYREFLFERIHEIVFYGKGGYDWDTVYNLPIRYREFIYNKIRDHYDKQAKEAEKQNKSPIPINTKPKQTPKIKPTYTAKSPRK
jgi:hypothetical protein